MLVTVGVDTHADFHVGVALDQQGGLLGELTVANEKGGYRRLLRWARGFGESARVGAGGTGSYDETSPQIPGSVAFVVNRPYRWAPSSRVRGSVATRIRVEAHEPLPEGPRIEG